MSPTFHHHEAEEKLIGILIQDPEAFLQTSEKLKPETFRDTTFQVTYRELREIYLEDGGHVEVTDLIERVQAQVSKPCSQEIYRAVEEAVTSQSLPWALDKVVTASRKRHLQENLARLLQKIETVDDIQPLLGELLQVAAEGQQVTGKVYSGEQIAEEIILRQEKRRKSTDTIEGHRTGFDVVDAHLGGLKAGRTGLLSGGYGQGKTALAINWMANIAVRGGVPSLFGSLEMDRSDVDDRLLGILTNTTVKHIQSGAMNTTLYDGIADIQKAPLYVSDNYPRDITALAFMLEKYARIHGIELFILDYVGEMARDSVKYREDRDERFSRWVKTIRDLAKRFRFHALILAQVNYQGQLAESKKMAAHADYYLHLDREGKQRFLEMRKNRFGPQWRRYAIQYDVQTQRMTEQGLIEVEEKSS